MPADRRLTIEFIRSADCTWPPQVKARAEEIIRLSSELATRRARLADLNMVEFDKIELLDSVASVLMRLSRAYTMMSKELVYHLAQSKR